jgi:predicted transglutaminase-like cysteine proteinase
VEAAISQARLVQADDKRVAVLQSRSNPVDQRAAIHGLGFGARETPPEGLLDFCSRQPNECGQTVQTWPARPETDGLMRIGLGPDLTDMPVVTPPKVKLVRPIRGFAATATDIETVNRVNRQINRAMVGVTDQAAFGRNEFWTMPLTAPEVRSVRSKPLADCEDFALEKRRALMAAGIPESAIYLAVAVSPRTSLHAVVIVATDRGDLVLDNLNDWLLGYQETGYTWVKRQSTTSLFDWTDAPVAISTGVRMASLSQSARQLNEAQATVTSAADDWSKPGSLAQEISGGR